MSQFLDFQPLQIQSTKGKLNLPSDFAGHWIILYFYPRNNTPGCTRQCQHFSANLEKFYDLNCQVFGINDGNLQSHQMFTDTCNLAVPILSDEKRILANFFGVFGTHQIKGVKYTGYRRDVVILSPRLEVVCHLQQVNPDESHLIAFERLMSLQKDQVY